MTFLVAGLIWREFSIHDKFQSTQRTTCITIRKRYQSLNGLRVYRSSFPFSTQSHNAITVSTASESISVCPQSLHNHTMQSLSLCICWQLLQEENRSIPHVCINEKTRDIILFNILNQSGMIYSCDGHRDGWTDILAANAVLNYDAQPETRE